MGDVVLAEEVDVVDRGHGAEVERPGVGPGWVGECGRRENLVHWGAHRLHDLRGQTVETNHDEQDRKGLEYRDFLSGGVGFFFRRGVWACLVDYIEKGDRWDASLFRSAIGISCDPRHLCASVNLPFQVSKASRCLAFFCFSALGTLQKVHQP